MANDRRSKPRPDSVDRRRPESQFGRGTGSFAQIVNGTFATFRQLEAQEAQEAIPTEVE